MIVSALKEKINKLTSSISREALVVCVVVLACLFSFGLGILAGKTMREGEITITTLPLDQKMPEHFATPSTQQQSATVYQTQTPPEPPILSGGQYVGSKKGSKYHLPWCAGAKAIKEENKIWFASKEEAEKAGYTPAGNCKGI